MSREMGREMGREGQAGIPAGSPAGRLARELAGELKRYGLEAQVSECEGIALVGIWSVGLAVWCEWASQGWQFRWSLDATRTSGRWRYTYCPCSAMETAVRRIVALCRERHAALCGAVSGSAGSPEFGG
ncbi:MAG TPA: hypothetical protein VFV66_32970 [Nonomuraea sp.]|nr:hypothetical protein [Nonomuraea sp.]